MSDLHVSTVHSNYMMEPTCVQQQRKWMRKMGYAHAMKFSSAIKKNEVKSFAGKWMHLDIILFSKLSQSQKDKLCMLSLMCGS